MIAWIFTCAFCFMVGYILQSVVDSFRAPSVITMKVERKPTYEITVFVVDSHGVPVPNARIGFLSNSGWMYSETNEFGYSDHESGEPDVMSITVNEKVILQKLPLPFPFPEIFPWYDNVHEKAFLIRIDD